MPTTSRRSDHEYRHLSPLFHQLADPATPDGERTRIRNALVAGHLPLAEHIAARYRDRGRPAADLVQVAQLGLFLAVTRFDPGRDADFPAFAVTAIIGEIRRYLRDTARAMGVPRRVGELRATVTNAALHLARELGRAPRPSEIARRFDMPIEDVHAGLLAGHAEQAGAGAPAPWGAAGRGAAARRRLTAMPGDITER